MGADSSKINNCCSCLEQTQVGEYSSHSSVNYSQLQSKKLNMISLQQGNISIIQEDSKAPTKNHNLILIGQKQSGKTTFIDHLKNKTSSSPLPTNYPGQSMLKTQVDHSNRALLISEIDFDYLNSNLSRSLTKNCEGYTFLIRYDKNKKNLLEQILSFSRLTRLDKNQKPCAVVINVIGGIEDSNESIKQEVKALLNQYSIKACATEILAECKSSFLSQMIKQLEALKISQAR